MPLKESDAFVLITYPLAEADKVVVLFTREFGKIRGVARGARRPKSGFGACLEPLSEIHASFFEKETRELVSLRRCELLMSPFEQGCSPEGELFLHHISELTDRFQPLAEPNDRVYRLIKVVMAAFRRGSDVTRLSTYFDLWTLRLSGFLGQWERCTRCQRPYGDEEIFLSSEATTFCQRCSPSSAGVIIAPSVRDLVGKIFRHDPLGWMKEDISSSAMQKIRHVTHQLITSILEHHLKTEIILIA